ncbi:MAG: hypothetical protein MJZ57_01030 [Bacteroidales bacterium]|nr:hypothetical protein [Bacteroidales bacterium]
MATYGGGGAGWRAPKNHTCCRCLSGKQIKANRKRIEPTTYAMEDRGSD